MGLVLGTNCGFVTTAPTGDPAADSDIIDRVERVIRDTSPSGATKIIEVGWYCINPTEEADFSVGLYAADGEVVPGEAGTLLYSDTEAKGTTAGWKSIAVDWEIAPSTIYWIAYHLEDTATQTNTYRATSGGSGYDNRYPIVGGLTNPFGGGAISDTDGMVAVYAIYEAAPATGTNTQVNIGDSWKEISAAKVNIGDTWKEVAGMQVNVGDTWKEVF